MENFPQSFERVGSDSILEQFVQMKHYVRDKISEFEEIVDSNDDSKVYFGDEKQEEVHFDSNPQTQINDLNSKTNQLFNPNLLINGDFRVNQRGASTYTGSGSRLYTVDRWTITSSASVSSINTSSISVNFLTQYQAIEQRIEDYEKLKGKMVTLSCKISNVTISSGNQLFLRYNSGDTNGTKQISEDGIYSLTFTVSNSATQLAVQIFSGSGAGVTYSFNLEWIKLEIGSIATPYSPRPYAEELALCQRYYQVLKNTNVYAIYWKGWFNGGTVNMDSLLPIPVTMRTKPTIKMNGNFLIVKTTGGTFSISSYLVHSMYDNQLLLRCVTTGGTQGQECIIQANNDATTSVEFDAEIY